MSRKVFTAGEVLAAADVNSFLMDQTVMSFAGTAARGSAIPTPTLGMYTHLEDTPARTQFWNGSAWVSPFGSTFITEVAFTTASAVNLNNVFTSAYQNYLVLLNISSVSTTALMTARMRVGGVDASSGAYFRAGIQTYSSVNNVDAVRSQGGTSLILLDSIGSVEAAGTIEVFSPNQARPTVLTHHFQGSTGGNYTMNIGSTNHAVSTAYDGMSIIPAAGTITGTVRVYGMRNN
jgi:hypothetical protein